jgi:hypothetical protein
LRALPGQKLTPFSPNNYGVKVNSYSNYGLKVRRQPHSLAGGLSLTGPRPEQTHGSVYRRLTGQTILSEFRDPGRRDTGHRPRLTELKPRLMMRKPRLTVRKPRLMMRKPRLMMRKPRLMMRKPRLTELKPRLTVRRPRLTVLKPRLTRRRPRLTVLKPRGA